MEKVVGSIGGSATVREDGGLSNGREVALVVGARAAAAAGDTQGAEEDKA